MKSKICFYILLILSITCLFCTWIKFENKNYINVIIETKLENADDILLKINNEYFSFKQFNNVLNQTIKKNIDSLEVLINTKHKNKIKNIVVFNDVKMHYFPDFSEFEKSKEELCLSNQCKNFDKYEFKKEIIKPHKNKFYSFINSLSQFDKIFYPFFILLSLTIFCGLKLNLNRLILPICIFILAIILRLSDINSYLPWGDECFSIELSQTHYPFLNLFNDPGNPPFHFFLLRIIQYFTNSFVIFRLSSVAFSLLAGAILFLFLKKNFSLKSANIALFLYAINLPIIYYSQEIRCYSLTVFFATLFITLTFKILEKPKKKYWIFYGLLSIIAVNTHYFQVLFVIANFLYLSFIFIKNKRKEDLFWLLGTSLLTLISFLPYYILTAHNQALLNTEFNAYLSEITFDLIKKCIYFIFGGFIPFLLSIIFLFKNCDTKTKPFYLYCFWTIFSVIFLGIILSFLIRPIMAQRYVLFLIPYALIILSFVFSFEYKKKWAVLLFMLCILLAQDYSKNSFVNLRETTTKSHIAFTMSQKNSTKNKKVIMISKASDSAIMRAFRYNHFELITLPKHNSYKILDEKIKKLKKENKNIIIFTPFLENNKQNALNKNYTCYFNSALDSCIWKIE